MIDRRTMVRALAMAAALPLLPRGLRAEDEPFRAPPPDALIERIAFGSCNDQRLSQDFWGGILSQDPKLLLMIGDNVYGDVSGAAMSELKDAYARLGAEPGFGRVAAQVPTLAIWDDHDYCANDAGTDFAYREPSAALLPARSGPGEDDAGRGAVELAGAAPARAGRRPAARLVDSGNAGATCRWNASA